MKLCKIPLEFGPLFSGFGVSDTRLSSDSIVGTINQEDSLTSLVHIYTQGSRIFRKAAVHPPGAYGSWKFEVSVDLQVMWLSWIEP